MYHRKVRYAAQESSLRSTKKFVTQHWKVLYLSQESSLLRTGIVVT